ncbi:MAG TPA: FAD-dependent thymidylate synthase [Candidatus Saccharimonadales bacterium]|nr:FAD-dependent thymidylate synthase [Candidatus Saccharimonadales bacterium]
MSNIFIYDEFSPEDVAMMQALYSRSPKSVTEHVEKVKQSGSGKFMATFYVGYGHASIADCGSTTIFIEDISIIGDKAIQDWQLYSGQETSTRYIDMGSRAIIDPLASSESKDVLDNWMKFYNDNQERIQAYLMIKYPRREDENEIVYGKAIAARGFDIMRGFLPAGITTQLSWHTNLRQAWDHLALLRHHPLTEVRDNADMILKKLKEKYEHSFSHQPTAEQEEYREACVNKYTYFKPNQVVDFSFSSTIKLEDLAPYQEILDNRPLKTSLPVFLGDLGLCNFKFILDFGSFRDIQRHRSGICRMPLLTTDLDFASWYLEQLPEDMRAEAIELIAKQKTKIDALNTEPEIKQYYIALGFNVDCYFSFPLPAAVYVTELRSNKTVHPSLRSVAHKMHAALSEKFPNLKLYVDLDLDDWDVRRGLADITTK